MTFDNSKTIINLRITFFLATILLLAYIALTYVARLIKFPLLGMSDTVWTLILVIIWFVLTFTPMFLNYQFIFFSDEGEKIIFRYFSTGLISGKKNSVEINKRTFSGYKIESRFFGLIQSMTLFQRFNEGVAKYPPVYISALSKEEKAKLIMTLKSYSPTA
jgi:predicted membrane protein